MKRWKDNWGAISPIFKFSAAVRKVIYTTNAIESLNSTYRKLNRQRSVFPSDTVLQQALYLATFEATKNGRCQFATGDRFMVNWGLFLNTSPYDPTRTNAYRTRSPSNDQKSYAHPLSPAYCSPEHGETRPLPPSAFRPLCR